MTVLVTNMKSTMRNREGFISYMSEAENPDAMTFDDFDMYIFKKCIKLNPKTMFDKWICIWDENKLAVVCDVHSRKLCNGFIQVVIYQKKIVPVNEIEKICKIDRNKTHQYFHSINGHIATLKDIEVIARETTETAFQQLYPSTAPAPITQVKHTEIVVPATPQAIAVPDEDLETNESIQAENATYTDLPKINKMNFADVTPEIIEAYKQRIRAERKNI